MSVDRAAAAMFPMALDFAQRLVRVPSMSGEEEGAARLVAREMAGLGYDDVEVDGAGNVIGTIRGGAGPVLMLNGHLDVVSPGDEGAWKTGGPWSGRVSGGRLWGRGAADVKGPLAMLVYAGAALKAAGVAPAGDVIVSAVVMEETGGLGMRHLLARGRRPDLVLIAEPTDLAVRIGHRGRMAVWVAFAGRAGHASMPRLAVNPNYAAAKFLVKLEGAVKRLPRHPVLGKSTIAPTLVKVDGTSSNVIPGETRVFLDWRSTGESPAEAEAWLRRHVGGRYRVEILRKDYRSWTGHTETGVSTTQEGFVLGRAHPFVGRVKAAVREVTGRTPAVGVWRFATDGRLTAAEGIPTLGYSPAEEAQCHVTDESIRVASMKTALRVYARLCAGSSR